MSPNLYSVSSSIVRSPPTLLNMMADNFSDTESLSSHSSTSSNGNAFFITFNLSDWSDEPDVAAIQVADEAAFIRTQLSDLLDIFQTDPSIDRQVQEARTRELDSLIVQPYADPEWAQRRLDAANAWAAAEVAAEEEHRAETDAGTDAFDLDPPNGGRLVVAPSGSPHGPAVVLDPELLDFVPGVLDAVSQRELDDYLEEWNLQNGESS